jgi:meso-butanediol dehydrogenase/(S,S)-butanediol dehydrogenase/diacetyl reductase
MIRFDGKVVLVTGGTAGFGLSTARLAREVGARVAVAGRREDRGREAEASLGGDSLYVPADVSVEGDVERMVAAVVERFGRLDVVVNNAGIVRRFPALDETTMGWDAVMDVNLRGVFACCRTALPHLIATRGSIVNISSVLALRSQKGRSPAYDASKAGVEAFTRALACQYGPYGVRANAVAPGFVETELTADVWADWSAADRAAFLELYPLRRLGTPDEIARAVLFLASEAAGWITGVSLIVDGGRSAA